MGPPCYGGPGYVSASALTMLLKLPLSRALSSRLPTPIIGCGTTGVKRYCCVSRSLVARNCLTTKVTQSLMPANGNGDDQPDHCNVIPIGRTTQHKYICHTPIREVYRIEAKTWPGDDTQQGPPVLGGQPWPAFLATGRALGSLLSRALSSASRHRLGPETSPGVKCGLSAAASRLWRGTFDQPQPAI